MQLAKIPLIGFLFAGWPGPIIAKFTPLWKIVHVLRNTFRPAVARLHEQSGSVVQIAPNEISVSDKRMVYIPKLTPLTEPVDAVAYKNLERQLGMSNLFSHEHHIDSCIDKFLALLSTIGDKGENFDLRALLTRYAFDTMAATTVGQAAGFLDESQDPQKIDAALADWKFYAVLYGSYLRYHPFIDTILTFLGYGDKTNTDALKSSTDREARIALALAGADPTITLIFNTIQHLYANPELAERLRAEIIDFRLSHAPSFKELILQKGHMPHLHALLLESARLQMPYMVGPQYIAGQGFEIADLPVAPGTKISLDPTTSHFDPKIFGAEPFSFKPERWLDGENVTNMRYSLLAFNASTSTPIESFQLLVASKFLTLMVEKVDLAACPKKPGHFYVINNDSQRHDSADVRTDTTSAPTCDAESHDVKIHPSSEGNKTPATLAAVDCLITILGNEDADEILNGRFAPHLDVFPKNAVITKPLENRRDRALVHEAISTIYRTRLEHFTHKDNSKMCIGPFGSIPPEYRPGPRNGPRRPRTQNGRSDNQQRNHHNARGRASTQQPFVPRPPPKADNAWGAWASTEEQKVLSFKTQESYQRQLASIAQEEQSNKPPPPANKYETTYKLTNGETNNGKLGGARRYIATEVTHADGKVTREEHSPPRTAEQSEQKQETSPKPKAVPPHLRRKLLQQQQEQEEKQKQKQEQE